MFARTIHKACTAICFRSPRPMTSPAAIADRLMDATIVPGFTSLGYRVRSRTWEPAPDLSGRSILITGASSGLGAAACELLAEKGATVHMLVRDLGRARAFAAASRSARRRRTCACGAATSPSRTRSAPSLPTSRPRCQSSRAGQQRRSDATRARRRRARASSSASPPTCSGRLLLALELLPALRAAAHRRGW